MIFYKALSLTFPYLTWLQLMGQNINNIGNKDKLRDRTSFNNM